MDVIRICIPGKPQPLERNRHRIVRPKAGPAYVSNYLPTKSRNEQAIIRDFASRAMRGNPPWEGPVDLRIVAYVPIPRSWSKKKQQQALEGRLLPVTKPDFDNYDKMVDALKHVVWRDDSQVCAHGFWKFYSPRPELVIEIRPIVL